MADVTTYINALEKCREQSMHMGLNGAFFDTETIDQIIALLKEQTRSKHGHWIVLKDCSNAGVYCSECHTKMFDTFPMKKKLSQYCGHCGVHNDLQAEVR